MADAEKQTKTIEYVNPEGRAWQGQKGTIYFVECYFDDNSIGSVAVFAKEKVDAVIESLKALRDTPSDFTVEDDGTYDNRQKWRIKDWPGKPEGLSGGGGGGRGGGGMSHAQVGYLAAASYLGPLRAAAPLSSAEEVAEEIIELGERLTQALFDRRPPNSQEAPADEATSQDKPEAAAPAVPAADRLSLPQMKAIKDRCESKGITPDQLAERLGVRQIGDLSYKDAADLLDTFDELVGV